MCGELYLFARLSQFHASSRPVQCRPTEMSITPKPRVCNAYTWSKPTSIYLVESTTSEYTELYIWMALQLARRCTCRPLASSMQLASWSSQTIAVTDDLIKFVRQQKSSSRSRDRYVSISFPVSFLMEMPSIWVSRINSYHCIYVLMYFMYYVFSFTAARVSVNLLT